MLTQRALYFPVVASLGDELEAARPRLPIGSSAKDQRIAWRSWAQWRCICFVNCWHRSPVESAAMWKIYAGRDQGIAIKSTFQSLANAFRPAAEDDRGQLVQAGLVEYIDPDTEEAIPRQLDGNKEVLRKRSWYSYEEELRLIFTIPQNMDYLEDCPSPRMAGVWMHCDLHRLIERVVVAAQAPPYLEPAIREVLTLFKFPPELVTSSRLNENVGQPDGHSDSQ